MTPLETPPEVEAWDAAVLKWDSLCCVVQDGRDETWQRSYFGTSRHTIQCGIAALAARTQQAEELAKELERAQSWDGIIDHLNRVYPAETFTGHSGDGGPTIVALTRALYAIGQTLDRTIARAHQAEARCRELEEKERVFWLNVQMNGATVEALSPTIDGAVVTFVPEKRVHELEAENAALRAEVERLTKERDDDEGPGGAHD